MAANEIYRPIVCERVTIGAAITQLSTLLAAAAWNAGTTRATIQNTDPANACYWYWGTAAPAALGDMFILPPLQERTFCWPADKLVGLYTLGVGAGSEVEVMQEGMI